MGTEIFKIEEEMTEKLKPKLGNPSLTAHNKYSLIIFTILWCIWVLGLNTSGKRYKINFLKCLTTSGFIFSVISSLILKISVAIEEQISWIFQNTPNFSILDDFILKVVIAIFLLTDTLFMFSRHLCEKFWKIIFHSLLHKKEHFYMLVPIFF